METYAAEVNIPRPADLGAGGERWKIRKLTGLTVVFGKNGSGKSRLLRAWRDLSPDLYHYIVPERVGTLTFDAGYLQEQMDPAKRKAVSGRNYAENYRQHIITRIQAYFLVRGSVRADEIPGDPAELEQLLTTLLPDFALSIDGKSAVPYKLLRAATGQDAGNIDNLSSGEAQVITVGLDVLTIAAMWDIAKTEKRIVLIDEPDAHIHPDLQVRFADFLVRVANRFKLQIIIATHSTTLLAALGQFGGESASVVYLDRTKTEFEAAVFSSEAKELAACLGGHALMGPLFGVPLLLVEGDDDYRIWSQVPRHHVVNFATIATNGDEIFQYQRSLEKIFQALRDPASPAGFALLDGDKQLPVASTQVPQAHVKFIRLACHEAENLYLTDEVLSALETDWPRAAKAISEAADKFGQKAPLLKVAETWDRKTVDVHDHMNQITQILDPKNVHWTIRVAKAIGKARPTGQLLDFLGESVVVALWGNNVG